MKKQNHHFIKHFSNVPGTQVTTKSCLLLKPGYRKQFNKILQSLNAT